MSQFQENFRTGRKDGKTEGQTLIHRTLPATAGVQKAKTHRIVILVPTSTKDQSSKITSFSKYPTIASEVTTPDTVELSSEPQTGNETQTNKTQNLRDLLDNL